MKKIIPYTFLIVFTLIGCHVDQQESVPKKVPFVWENANLYFLLTDRFYNGDTSNDVHFNRIQKQQNCVGLKEVISRELLKNKGRIFYKSWSQCNLDDTNC